jgi:hypothetical protein
MGSKKGSGVPEQWFLQEVVGRFVERSPVTVMVQAVLENVFAAEPVDALFKDAAERQYTKQLLFSSLVDLMSSVVCGKWPSVRVAYDEMKGRIPVTLAAVYQKLNGVEPQVSAALVRDVAGRLRKVVEKMGGQLPDLLPGYSLRILDGNHLAATDRRIKVLRRCAAGPLPGFGLVVLDPAAMLVEHLVPCVDGHAQERSLTKEVLELVRPGQAWLDDRNFCTSRLLFGIADRDSCFITRQHATNVRWEPAGARKRIGRCSTGMVYEQRILLTNDDGDTLFARRITVVLDDATRDGDSELNIVTNLPRRISAVQVAELYRKRWTLETVFQELATMLNGEINTLCYPKAALFAFAVALVAFNALSAVKAALRAVHGHERIQKEFSDYYLAIHLRATHEGMMIAVPDAAWDTYRNLTPAALAKELTQLAAHVNISKFPKAPTVARRRPLARLRYRGKTHVSTARLLDPQLATRRAP